MLRTPRKTKLALRAAARLLGWAGPDNQGDYRFSSDGDYRHPSDGDVFLLRPGPTGPVTGDMRRPDAWVLVSHPPGSPFGRLVHGARDEDPLKLLERVEQARKEVQ